MKEGDQCLAALGAQWGGFDDDNPIAQSLLAEAKALIGGEKK